LGAFAQPAQPPAADTAAAAAPVPGAADAPGAKAPDQPKPEAAPAKPSRPPFETLMFTTDEYTEIQGRIASGSVTETNQGKQAIEDASLYLSTILYYGPKDWTIWVNGVAIGPNQDFQAFQVTEIDANSVQLLVPLSAQGMRPVRLAPNQTFITKTGMVVEGRVQ
jgi:hypothetical protein